jgi:hypothetical protein
MANHEETLATLVPWRITYKKPSVAPFVVLTVV